tara:strand:- start:33 stop:608 length:576 start_codon:yes stop_codon:yes gene_type:complete
MVKNSNGGRHKHMARKHISGPSTNNNKLRVSEDDAEVYAVTTKMLGNGRFYAKRISGGHVGTECIGIIRGKFRGKGKRNNIVMIGTVVLLGEREWTSTDSVKHHECDLLEVYSDSDKERLCSEKLINHSDTIIDTGVGGGAGTGGSSGSGSDAIEFATQDQIDATEFLHQDNSKSEKIEMDNGQKIDIDDI